MALKGLKVIELAGLAPAPFCGMILSDFGATVTRIDKPNTGQYHNDGLSRGKRSVAIDLKNTDGVNILRKLCNISDVILDPFRAGVMEKLHLGPEELCKSNPRLVYARLTGFGQNGPFSKMAGHDINYIALSGVLSTLGPYGNKPYHPINLLGDFAGGGLICALGICMTLLERAQSGKGQVVDANMVEGSAYLSSWLWTTRDPEFPIPLWVSPRGKNILDGGAPFYQTYQTKDGKFMAVGALEPKFYAQFLEGLGLDVDNYPQETNWPEMEETFTRAFASKTQEEWCKTFDYKDACVTPVVPLEDAHQHIHNADNNSFLHDGKKYIPRPAPNLSRTPCQPTLVEPLIGQHTIEVLQEAGYTDNKIESLRNEGAISAYKAKASL